MSTRMRKFILIIIFAILATILNVRADYIFGREFNSYVDRITQQMYKSGVDGAEVWTIRSSLMSLKQDTSQDIKNRTYILIVILLILTPLLLKENKNAKPKK